MINSIILAGGKSRRIQPEKAFRDIGGKPVVGIIIDKLRELSSRIIVVTNDPSGYENYKVQLVEDIIKDKGPLAGLYSGLNASATPANFVVGCDMPFISVALIRYMIDNIGENDVIVPEINKSIEPLHGVYRRTCIPFIREEIDRGNMSVKSFYKHVRVKCMENKELARFDPEFKSFFNINTPEDLKKARLVTLH